MQEFTEDMYKEKIEGALKNMRQPFRHYPRCNKCPLSKDMSLICLNPDCGENNYFKLICPYCHRNEHQMHQLKVEDDLDLVLQIIEDHTRKRYMTKQVSDQDVEFIDILLESQKAMNKLLNKIQQVKFILDDTLNGYKRRMKEYEDMIRIINNAQMSSSQAIINEQLSLIKSKIIYNCNETDVDIVWNFEKNYNETDKKKRTGYSEQCLKTINHCEKSFKNLLQNFQDVVNPILEKRLIQKVCLDECNSLLDYLSISWRWEKYEDIEIKQMNAFQNGRNYRPCIQLSNKLEEVNIFAFISGTSAKDTQKKEIEMLIQKWKYANNLLQVFQGYKQRIEDTRNFTVLPEGFY